MKPVNVKFHLIGDLIAKKGVKLLKLDIVDNIADFGTKVVTNLKFKRFLDLLYIGRFCFAGIEK